MAKHWLSELVRLVYCRSGDRWLQPLEQFDSINALFDQSTHCGSCFIFGIHDDAGALPSEPPCALRWRPVDDVSRCPYTRTAYAAVFDCFALRDYPFHRVVRKVGARDYGVGKIDFTQPVAVMAMTVYESWKNTLAIGSDDFRILKDHNPPPPADSAKSSLANNDDRIRDGRSGRPIDQCGADDGNRLTLRPAHSNREAENKQYEKFKDRVGFDVYQSFFLVLCDASQKNTVQSLGNVCHNRISRIAHREEFRQFAPFLQFRSRAHEPISPECWLVAA